MASLPLRGGWGRVWGRVSKARVAAAFVHCVPHKMSRGAAAACQAPAGVFKGGTGGLTCVRPHEAPPPASLA